MFHLALARINFFCFFIFTFSASLIFSQDAELDSTLSQESFQVDILFLKIQELESQIERLTDKVEAQDFLIDKLIQESSPDLDNNELDINTNSSIRFKGLNDARSLEEVFDSAINSLENQDFVSAKDLFKYFIDTFEDEEKLPLSYFWIGEIGFINENYEESKNYFTQMITLYPNHYRIPIAHKKIGDIFLKNNEFDKAKEKYNFVVREFPDNTASSLALQLLKNME